MSCPTPSFALTSPRLGWAIDAVLRACQLTARLQERTVACAVKGDLSPVTVADYASQALIAHDLAFQEPELELVAEEDTAELEHSPGMAEAVARALEGWLPHSEPRLLRCLLERSRRHHPEGFWALDPLDGTKGFLRNAHFAVALAWVQDGQPQLGVLGCPRLKLARYPEPGVLAAASKDGGSWVRPLDGSQDWTRLQCHPCTNLSQARLLHSYEPSHTNLDEIGRLRSRLRLRERSIGIDSQAKYVMLAAGEGDFIVRTLNENQPDYREKIWDHAAGQIILHEAGGLVSDLEGQPLDYRQGRTLRTNRGLLASAAPELHRQLLAALSCSSPSGRFGPIT